MSNGKNNHSLDKIKGRDLQSHMAKQVDGTEWQHGVVHNYYIGDEKSQGFALKPKPNSNQPGNGLLQFRDSEGKYNAPSYSDLRDTIQNPTFPEKRKEWQNADMKNVNFKSPSVQANALLDFEVARRTKGENYLSRSQVQKGVDKAMKAPPNEYLEQVS